MAASLLSVEILCSILISTFFNMVAGLSYEGERFIHGRQRRNILHRMPFGGGSWDCNAGSALLHAWEGRAKCTSQEFLTFFMNF